MALTFNEQFYLQNNPDVQSAVLNGVFTSGLQHFQLFGANELRDPNATFDTSYYANQNPDVVSAIGNGTFDGNLFDHFTQFGVNENRPPVSGLADFDAEQYLAANSDVQTAIDDGTIPSALFHFLEFGQAEGRQALDSDGNVIDFETDENVGETFELTTGVDNIEGTANNDTIRAGIDDNTAANNTLTVLDQIDGDAGTDTLNVIADASGAGIALPTATISGVENLFFRNVSGQTLTVDANIPTGEQQLWSDRSTDQVDFTNVAAGTTIGVKGDGNVTNADTNAAHVAAVTSASVAITGGTTAGSITLTGAGLTETSIATSGSAKNTVGTIDVAASKTVTVDGAANLTATAISTTATDGTLNVKGAGMFTLGALDAGIDTVDASGNAGGVTLTLDAETDTKFTGGSGDDRVTAATSFASADTASINAADGSDDRLVVNTTAHMDSTDDGDKYSNFEVLEVGDGASVDIDVLSTNNSLTAVRINEDADGATAVTDLTAEQASNITVVAATNGGGNITIGVKDATVPGNTDTVKMTFDDGDTTTDATYNIETPQIAGVEKIEMTAADADETVTVEDGGGLTAMNSMTIAGAADFGITWGTNAVAANTDIDGSAATGVLTLDWSDGTGEGVSLKGGSDDDTLTGTNIGGKSDAIVGGAGDDTIIGEDGDDILTGGDGSDTFTFDGDPATNGTDDIKDFTVGAVNAGGDVLDLSALTAAAGTANVSAVASNGATALTDNDLFVVDLDTSGKDFGGGDFADLFGAGKAFATTDSGADPALAFVVVRDDDGDADSQVYAVDSSDGDAIDASNVTLIGTLEGITSSSTFVAANFDLS